MTGGGVQEKKVTYCFYICENCSGVSDVNVPCIITEKKYRSFSGNDHIGKDYCIGSGRGGAVWNRYVFVPLEFGTVLICQGKKIYEP